MSVRARASLGTVAKTMFSAAVLAGLAAIAPAQASYHRHHNWQATAVRWTDPEKDAALVVDGNSGRVLFARNPDALRHPASLTKMMTLYLLFEQLKSGQMTLATPIPVSEHAAIQAPTKLHARPGTSVPTDVAIKSLVVLSANDMAVAIAEAIGGTESHFAEMMTAKARQLGMAHTFYHNASGLPDELQITTASDLAILARRLAYDFPQYFHYFSTPSFTYAGVTHFTHDNLIGRYDGADGIKTGYTNASGFNLVSSVVRNGSHIIGVVMGGVTARRRDAEMMRMLDSTFASINQNPQMVASANVPWQTVAANTPATPVIAGFQIAGALSGPAAPGVHATAASEPSRPGVASPGDDEEAAESRPDPELDQQPHALSPDVKTPPVQTVTAANLPANPAPVPVDIRKDVTRLALAAPPPALPLKPPAIAASAPPPVFIPHVAPRPRPQEPGVVLASFQPQSVAPTIIPKPREALIAKKIQQVTLKPSVTDALMGQGQWSIQIGAFADPQIAKAQLASYAERSMDVLGQADRQVIAFQSAEGHTLFRARFGPFPEREAREVCQRLTERGQTCFAALAQR